MGWKDISKKLSDTFLEDDGSEKKAPAKPAAAPSFGLNLGTAAAAPTPGFAPTAPSPFAVPGTVVLDEAVYQKIFKLTDFDQTEVGQAMHKYYDALPDVLDTNTKFKTALAQAAKLDGITPDRVLAAFDGLKASLAAESDKFARIVDTQTQREVVGRQTKLQQFTDQIAQLTQQIADLQQQHTQVSAELADAQGKISNAQQQFQLATNRRSQEIDQQKAQFAALLMTK